MLAISNELKEKAIYLRSVERNSVNEIVNKTGISKATLSTLLRKYPLTEGEKRQRRQHICRENNPKRSKKNQRGNPSSIYCKIQESRFNPMQIGIISEAAILFKLNIHGFRVFKPAFDGEKCDFLVINSENVVLKIQVKTFGKAYKGMPIMKIVSRNGKYKSGDCDFLIGYDSYSDSAYIYTFAEINNHKTSISLRESSRENWNLLNNVAAVA